MMYVKIVFQWYLLFTSSIAEIHHVKGLKKIEEMWHG